MSELYFKEHLENLKKRLKMTTIIGIITQFLGIIAFFVLCFFANTENITIIKIADGILLVASAWIAFYLLGSYRTELNDKIEHIENMLNGKRENVQCKIGIIKKPATITFNIFAYEIIDCDSGLGFYFESESPEIPFSVGDVVDFALVNNYIVAYEVKK